MKYLFIVTFVCAFNVGAQTPAANIDPQTALATIEGKKLTMGDLQKYMAVLPPQMQQGAVQDRKGFLQQYGLMMRLSQLAEKAKLDQQSPAKEALEFNRMYVLMNAELNDAYNHVLVLSEDQQKYYEANKDRYSQVNLKVIYIPFSANAAKAAADPKARKVLTEAEAKEKIEKLAKEVRGGADFVKLVKEHSEDQTSVAKDGDFGTVRRSDNLPDAIRSVVFNLKPGELGGPVKQPNGFYLFRAEQVSTRPYAEVKDEIFAQLKQDRFKEWLDRTRSSLNIKIENEAFFSGSSPAAPKAPAGGSK